MRIHTKIENGIMYAGATDNSSKDIGDCPYCHKPVYAAPGQCITWVKRTPMAFGEPSGQPKSYPTHKACRKLSTHRR